jgi:hypothetical protein
LRWNHREDPVVVSERRRAVPLRQHCLHLIDEDAVWKAPQVLVTQANRGRGMVFAAQ